MALTSDDFISMHKAAEDVVQQISLLPDVRDVDSLNGHIDALKDSVLALAVIQRDLLKAALGG